MVIAACAISMLIVQMDWFALNLALPPIASDFDVPTTDLQWILSGYMLSIGALMVTAGRLADLYGRRKIIVIGLVVFGVLSVICGAATDETWLIAARVVQGVGAALIFPISIAVVSSAFAGARQSRAIGVVLGFAAIGTAIGPFIGGLFAEHVSWRAIFFFNVPFCIAAVVLMLRYVKETRDTNAERHIDVPGMAAVTGGLVAISYGIDKGQAWGWTSVATVGTILGGVDSARALRLDRGPGARTAHRSRTLPQSRIRRGDARRLALKRGLLLRRSLFGPLSSASRAPSPRWRPALSSSRCRAGQASRATTPDGSPSGIPPTG